MRVLLVANHWTEGPGGAETMAVLTADLQRAAGHEVVPFAVDEERTLPTPVRAALPAAAGAGARTRFGEVWAGTWSPRAYRALARVVDEVRPDVAHVHHVFERLAVSVLDAPRRRRVPTVMTLHDYKPVCPNYRLFTEGGLCLLPGAHRARRGTSRCGPPQAGGRLGIRDQPAVHLCRAGRAPGGPRCGPHPERGHRRGRRGTAPVLRRRPGRRDHRRHRRSRVPQPVGRHHGHAVGALPLAWAGEHLQPSGWGVGKHAAP